MKWWEGEGKGREGEGKGEGEGECVRYDEVVFRCVYHQFFLLLLVDGRE